MKTKINTLIKILFCINIFLFSISSTNANLTAVDSVSPMTSGIKSSYYEVVWCSPQYTHLTSVNSLNGVNCQKGYFNKVGSEGIMTYKGENFKNGNVKLLTGSSMPAGTRSSTVGALDFFDGISNIKFEGEGTYTLRILLIDYAYNASKFEFTYKVDKTAPQFMLNSISENTPYTYAGNRIINLSGSIVKYDSNSTLSNDLNKYNNPEIFQYTGDSPVSRNLHTRKDLYSFYFKDLASQNFNLNVNYDDNYNNYLAGGNTLVAGPKNFDLMPENGNTPIKTNISLSTVASIVTSDLTSNSSNNSQKKYRLRLYDNTVGNDPAKTPNYSEIVFYAIRDNTPPNMGGNSLAGTNRVDAVERLLKFGDNATTFDKTISGYNPEDPTKGYSRFITANNSEVLTSLLSDIGIVGDGTISGNTTADKYEWHNSGIPIGSLTKVKIEQSGDKNMLDVFTPFTDRFTNNKTLDKNFSVVDGDRSNGYRKYQTAYETDGLPGICDNVGNCLTPKLDFRVVANTLANNTSKLTLTSPTKVVANGSDQYTITSEFKDIYGNNIVGVKSGENIGNPIIKTVDTYFDFTNGLNIDQKSNNPTGNKLVLVNDAEADNSLVNTGNINTAGNIYFKENEEVGLNNNAGIYKFKIASKVPTNGLYPYLTNTSILKLNNVKPKALVNTTSLIAYGTLGAFDKQTTTDITLAGTTNFLTYNNDFITKGNTTTDVSESDQSSYGNIALSSASNVSFSTLNSRKLQLEFASPYVYGLKDFSLAPLYSFNSYAKHNKKLYTIPTTNIPTIEKISEKFLSSYGTTKHKNGVVNFSYKDTGIGDVNNGHTFTNSNINSIKTGNDFEVKISPALASYDTNTELKLGYTSYLSYKIGTDEIFIPSASRNVSDIITGGNDSKFSSRFYFPDGNSSYVIIGDGIQNFGVGTNLGIAVTGLTNKSNKMTNDATGVKSSTKIGENLTRYDLLTTFKQNIVKNSAGLGGTSGLDWCNNLGTIDQYFINNGDNKNCTVDINGEKISFIKGNVEINCGLNDCILPDNKKRTIIVQDGYTYIKSNISTYNKNSQLLIGTVTDKGLQNINISDDLSFDISNATINTKIKGWTLIDPKVTNIDSYIVSQGPLVTYDILKLKLYGNTIEASELRNQLHIHGAVLSLNTIGGFKADINDLEFKCPYIIENCTSSESSIFDLIFLRRYNLIGKKFYDSNYTGNDVTAYHPNGYDIAKRSGGKTGYFDVNASETCGPDLRCINDIDYKKFPFFVQRDVSWNNSPSIMFRTDR